MLPWSCPHPKAQYLPPLLAPRCALESGEFLIKTPLLGIKGSAVFQEFSILAKSSQPAVLDANTLFPTMTVRSLSRSFTWVTNWSLLSSRRESNEVGGIGVLFGPTHLWTLVIT